MSLLPGAFWGIRGDLTRLVPRHPLLPKGEGTEQEAEKSFDKKLPPCLLLTLSFRKERVARNEPGEVSLIPQVKLRQVFR